MRYQRRVVTTTTKPSFYNRYVGWVIVLVAMILATVAFILVLGKRLDDGAAREMVRMEKPTLDDATTKLQEALLVEQRVLFESSIAQDLSPKYMDLKAAIENNTVVIQAIDVQESLVANITQMINQITTGYDTQITALENAFYQLLSVVSSINATTIKSGTCTLQGLTSTSVNYDYKKFTISGLDYYYYVFMPSATMITVNNTGFSIEGCTNGGLYAGSNNGLFASLLSVQLNRFGGDAASEITQLGAGDGKLVFQTTAFTGNRTVSIVTSLSHFIEFF